MTERSKPRGFVKIILVTLVLFFLALVLNVALVYFVWDGDAVAFAREIVDKELAMISSTPDDQVLTLIFSHMEATRAFFTGSGVEAWMRSAAATNEGAFSIVERLWPIYQSVVVTTLIFVERVTVLVLALPFFGLMMVLGAIDGGVSWYLRRLVGGRESAFLFHRAKYAIHFGVVLLLVVYLLPPVALDPRIVLPPFLIYYAVVSRLVVSRFKKYI